jgi:hypothetical protein
MSKDEFSRLSEKELDQFILRESASLNLVRKGNFDELSDEVLQALVISAARIQIAAAKELRNRISGGATRAKKKGKKQKS